jgi:hypothetical protein
VGAVPDVAVTGRWSVVSGSADVRAARLDDAWMVLAITAASESLVRVNTPFFPGWHLSLDGRPAALERAADSGYMQIAVPAGLHVLEARFENTLVRRVANVTSLGSVLLLSLFVISYEPAAYRRAPRRTSFDSPATAGWRPPIRE